METVEGILGKKIEEKPIFGTGNIIDVPIPKGQEIKAENLINYFKSKGMSDDEALLKLKSEFNSVTVESILGSEPVRSPIKDIGLIPSHKTYYPEPPPFKIDDVVYDWQKTRSLDEDPPQDEIANILGRISAPFKKLWYSSAGALNQQLGSLMTNFNTVFEYAEEKRIAAGGKPISPEKRGYFFKILADQYEQNADYWQALAAKSPPDFINEFIGKFVGSLGPGMVDFGISLSSLLTYPAILGAAEAKKQGAGALGETVGAITKAAEVGLLGLIFKGLHPFSLYVKAPILGTTFGVEDAAKQLVTKGEIDKDQLIEATATGFGLGLTPGGRMGLKEIGKNLRDSIKKTEIKSEVLKAIDQIKPEDIAKPETLETLDRLIDEAKVKLEPKEEGAVKIQTKEGGVVTPPEPSPTAKDQFKLPGIKIGIEAPVEKPPPTMESTPLMEAAIKAEKEKAQPGLEFKKPKYYMGGDIIDAINWLTGGRGISPTSIEIEALKPKEIGMYGKANIIKKGGVGFDTLKEELNALGFLGETPELSGQVLSAMEGRKEAARMGVRLKKETPEKEAERLWNRHLREDPRLEKEETIKSLTDSFNDEIMGFREELLNEGWSEDTISRAIEEARTNIESTALPPDFEGIKKAFIELVPKPTEVRDRIIKYGSKSEKIPAGEGIGPLFDLAAKAGPSFPEVISSPTGEISSGVTHVFSEKDAAHIGSLNLERYAQEQLYSILTNKDEKILGIYRHSIGDDTHALATIKLIAGQAVNFKDAENIWLVHNHPSGTSKLSPQDMDVFESLKNLLEGTGIRVPSMVAVGEKRYGSMTSENQPVPEIKPHFQIPMVERIFTRRGEEKPIKNSEEATEFMKKYLPEGGILLLSGDNRPSGGLEVKEFMGLRQGPLRAILSEIEKRNASGFVIYDPNREVPIGEAENMHRFTAATNMNLLDIIDREGSWADQGRLASTKGGSKSFSEPGLEKLEGKSESELEELRRQRRLEEQFGGIRIGQPRPTRPLFEFSDPGIEKSYQESVPKKEPFTAKAGEYFTDIWHKMTRPYEHLPRNKEFAQLQFDLTKLGKQKGVASYNAVMGKSPKDMGIAKILSGLKREDYNLFTRNVIVNDLIRESDKGHDLPWGFDKDSLRIEKVRLDTETANNPAVQDALTKRKAMWDTLKDDYTTAMQDIGFDVSERFKNEDYFRHQILEYVNLKGLFGTGKRLKTPTNRGFLKAREGSELDINRDFIEPEYEVMSQMFYDIQVSKTIKNIDKNYSIADQVKKDAKAKGLEDWHEAIPRGYVPWQPREGNVFYMADSIPAKLAEKLHSGLLEELGITKDDLRRALAVGGKRRELVVKEEVAKTLDELVKTKTASVLGNADRELMRGIKAWFLFAPRRYLKYEARNMTGDSDASFVGNPRGFLKTPQATKELGDVLFGKKEITGELKEFFDRGGFDSTLFAQEMGDLKSLWTFERLYKEQNIPEVTEIPYRVWKKYWKTIRVTNTFRETILRYGNYLDYFEQMKADANGKPKNFGASKPEEIMGLKDIRDRAYWLSNDLLGAYDRISVMGQHLREYWYPFWSWKELNFKRYVQFAKNLSEDGQLAQAVGKKAIGTLAKTPFMAAKVGRFLISATAFWSALQVWNHTMFPDEEDDLAEDIKSQPHIIFGKDSEGNIIYFNRIGALGDFLEWFGLDNSPKYVDKWMKGEMTLKEIAEDMVKSPINIIVQGTTPQIKVPAEFITGRTLFPDVFKPGTIRDRGFYLSRVLGLENEYKEIAGLPSKGYADSLKNFFVYSADPGQGAYSEIQETKRRWLKQQGKGAEGFWLTPRGNALYNLKLAIRYKDEEALNKYMYEYYALGGNARGIEESLKRMDPRSGLTKREREQFEESLSLDQVKQLEKAVEFYEVTLRGNK